MARPKKIYQEPTIEPVSVDTEKPIEHTKTTSVRKNSTPVLIPNDDSVVARRAPTMDNRHIAKKLSAGYSYGIDKIVHSIIYGNFYLLTDGLYVSEIGNFIVRE